MKGQFVTAINCMDGRVQEPVIKLLKTKYNADYIDMITEPGPNLILSKKENTEKIQSIKSRVDISVKKHKSNLIAIVGHYDCAGNPKPTEAQIEDIKKSIKVIKNWNYNLDVIGIWVNSHWIAEII